jgi:hypothetical protein
MLMTAVVLSFGFYACSSTTRTSTLASYCNKDAREFLENPDQFEVDAVVLKFFEESSESYTISDPAIVQMMMDDLYAIDIKEEIDEVVEDQDLIIEFVMTNGNYVSYAFNGNHFVAKGKNYVMANDSKL